ncbi:MAG: hypothetical protein J0H37_09145, partial [Hyphomicrobium denitrificans]|nr:hypothetical protein [Hyphomicrobium denitrificans]
KSDVFRERLAAGAAERLELTAFDELTPLMATVRTRTFRTRATRASRDFASIFRSAKIRAS